MTNYCRYTLDNQIVQMTIDVKRTKVSALLHADCKKCDIAKRLIIRMTVYRVAKRLDNTAWSSLVRQAASIKLETVNNAFVTNESLKKITQR